MTELLDLCYDILIRVLEEINPEDVAACAQTSTAFNEFIRNNTRLYKAHYLKQFVCFILEANGEMALTCLQDDPRRRRSNRVPDWVAEVQRLVKCRKILESADNDIKVGNRVVKVWKSLTMSARGIRVHCNDR